MEQPEIIQAINDLGRKLNKMEEKLNERFDKMEDKLEKIHREAQDQRKQSTDEFNYLARLAATAQGDQTRLGEHMDRKISEATANLKASHEGVKAETNLKYQEFERRLDETNGTMERNMKTAEYNRIVRSVKRQSEFVPVRSFQPPGEPLEIPQLEELERKDTRDLEALAAGLGIDLPLEFSKAKKAKYIHQAR